MDASTAQGGRPPGERGAYILNCLRAPLPTLGGPIVYFSIVSNIVRLAPLKSSLLERLAKDLIFLRGFLYSMDTCERAFF